MSDTSYTAANSTFNLIADKIDDDWIADCLSDDGKLDHFMMFRYFVQVEIEV